MTDKQPDQLPWEAFVRDWKSIKTLVGQPEQAVREQILAPMLMMLGYGMRTINDVLYENIDPLPDEYRMVGARRIKVDYIPTIQLERFWVMEAKKPGSLANTASNKMAFLQAHFYATYPTIRARYIVLADGEQLRFYDSLSTALDEARLIVRREDAETTFGAFYDLLAARNLLDAIRRDVLDDAERILAKEIDANAPALFGAALSEISRRVAPQISENIRKLIVSHHQDKTEARASYLRTADLRTILAVMNTPTEVGYDISNELVRRLTEGPVAERELVASSITMALAEPVRQSSRIFIMRALLLAAAARSTPNWSILLSIGISLARENLGYAQENSLLNARFHLENAADRISMKITQYFLEDSAARSEELARKTSALEDLIKDPPSKNFPLIFTASGLTTQLTKALQTDDTALLLSRVRAVRLFEKTYLPDRPSHLKGDQILLALKGVEFDFLIRATVDVLYQVSVVSPNLLPEDLTEIANGWSESVFPEAPPISEGDFDLETYATLEASFAALKESSRGLTNGPGGQFDGPIQGS